MAVQFPDPNPTSTSNAKNVQVKVVRLLATDFVIGNTASVKAVLPADSTIISIDYWKKTQFTGNSVSAVLLTISAAGVAQYTSNTDLLTPAAGTYASITPMTNIMQAASAPVGNGDLNLTFTGAAATGNPTAGEVYVSIYYVR